VVFGGCGVGGDFFLECVDFVLVFVVVELVFCDVFELVVVVDF